MSKFNSIVVLGPTASGKTTLAVDIAIKFNGEIISADSRQVYKHLDIGTGKDLETYKKNEFQVPHHVIDIIEPSQQFYLHDFVHELSCSFSQIIDKNKLPIICGGTGMYLDALRKNYELTKIKENATLRHDLSTLDKSQLIDKLNGFPEQLVAHVDRSSEKRLIRGIEVASYLLEQNLPVNNNTNIYKPYYIGIKCETDERKRLIVERLNLRINNGLIEEVEQLLKEKLTHTRLQNLGLEYKFISLFLQNKITRNEMIQLLSIAICQYSKRQMTWFRKMEREGVKINWLERPFELDTVFEIIQKNFPQL